MQKNPKIQNKKFATITSVQFRTELNINEQE